MNKEEFYKDIKKIYEQHGFINRKLLEKEILNYNVGWQLSKYHGLKNICDELNIKYIQASKLNDNDILFDIQRVFKTNGKVDVKSYDRYGKYSNTVIKSHFGSFNNALKLLNISENTSRFDGKEDVIKDFMNFYNKYNSTSSTLYRKYGKYSQSVIKRLFGSWNNLMDELHLQKLNTKVGIEYMLEEVKKLYLEYGFLSAKLINDKCDFTYQALSYHLTTKEISNYIGCTCDIFNHKSTGAMQVKNILFSIFGEEGIIEEYTECWLKNPRTNKKMYVDFFIKSKNIAIEYDGEQHYKFVKFIHRTYKNFYNQVYRDRLKEKILCQHGIKTIRLKYDDTLSEKEIYSKIESTI